MYLPILSFRGTTFRSTLSRIGEVRSIIPEGAHCYVLTATATSLLCSKIIEIIGLQDPKIIAVSPCKANNIMYSMSNFFSIETSFGPILEHINYPSLEQLDVMKILSVFINILEQVYNLKEVSWNQVMPQTSLDSDL